MKKTPFIINRNRIIHKYLKESIVLADENLYGQYTMMSANLSNYLPEIDPLRHMRLFIQLLIHKKLSKLEQASEEALSYLKTEGLTDNVLKILREGPSIISTFHTGSYRLINLFLVRNQVPFTLVIGKSIIEQEGEGYISLYRNLCENCSNEGFRIIDAENPQSGIQMLRELKRGRSLLLYLDGNAGAGSETSKNENHYSINFLHQKLYARKGIGFISHAANVPVIPVINYRQSWNEIQLRFCAPIFPDPSIDRDAFSCKVTQKLYDLVSPIIKKYPEQWEAWLYLHKVANISRPDLPIVHKSVGNHAIFNLRHFGVFQIGSKRFLFQKSSYSSYAIDYSLFKLLKKSVQKPMNVNEIERDVLTELNKNGVLLYL